MAIPDHNTQGGRGTGERIKAAYRRSFGLPTPLWLLIAAPVVVYLIGLLPVGGNQVPKRWKSITADTPSELYTKLVNPSALPACESAALGCSDKPMPPPLQNWNKPHVAVYSVAGARHPLPTLRDLGDRGQAKAIELLAKSQALEGKSWTQLRDALSDSGAGLGEKDPFQFDRILVATVAKGASWNPGDRMMWTRVFVQPVNFSFAGYTVAATDNETVKVTSIESTNSRKFSADIGLTVPGLEGPKANAGPSREQSVKTTSDIRAQYEKLGIDIMPKFLRIIRESETGGDVVGNTTLSLSIVTDALTIQKRFPSDESHTDPIDDGVVLLVTATHLDGDGPEDGVKQPADNDRGRGKTRVCKGRRADLNSQVVTRSARWSRHSGMDCLQQRSPTDDRDHPLHVVGQNVEAHLGADPLQRPGQEVPPPITVLPQVPVPHCALRARVWMLYEERQVDSGRDSYDESRQAVSLLRDAVNKEDVEVMGTDEVSPAVWSIEICDKKKCDEKEKRPLQASAKNGQPRNVVFTDYGQAVKLAHWLRTTQKSTVPGTALTFNYPANPPKEKESLIPVKKVKYDCDPDRT